MAGRAPESVKEREEMAPGINPNNPTLSGAATLMLSVPRTRSSHTTSSSVPLLLCSSSSCTMAGSGSAECRRRRDLLLAWRDYLDALLARTGDPLQAYGWTV